MSWPEVDIPYLLRISDLRKSQSMRTAGVPSSAIIRHSCMVTKLLPSLGVLLVIMMVLTSLPQKLRLMRSWLMASLTSKGNCGILPI